MKKLRSLFAARKGTATVEFALMSLFLFGATMVALDFGFYTQQKMKLGSVVEQAAILAYNKQVTNNTATIRDYVQNYSGLKSAPTATISCNGGGSAVCGDGKCSCINATTGAMTVVATCNAACSGSNAYSGNYLKVVASATYSAVIVPNSYLGGGTMTQTAVVRLQ